MKKLLLRLKYFSLALMISVIALSGCVSASQSQTAKLIPSSGKEDQLKQAIVELQVSCVTADPVMPWKNSRPFVKNGYAIAVGSHKLLTIEPLTRNATLLQIRRADSGARETVQLSQSDVRSGLSLLELDPGSPPLQPLGLVDCIQRQAIHELARFGVGDQLQRSVGSITAVTFEKASEAAASLLTFEIVSDLRAGQAGTPVLRDGKIAGIVLRLKPDNNASLAIAPEVISRFMAAAQQKPFVGVPATGFEYASLTDPVRRRNLKVADNDLGIIITAIQPRGSVDGVLRNNDVLLRCDNYEIDNQGYHNDAEYGRVPLEWLAAGRRKAGDKIPVEVVRQGTNLNLVVTLREYDDNALRVPQNATGLPNNYVIEGGLVFRDLTVNYLKSQGDKWQLRGPARLVWEATANGSDKDSDGDDRVLFLATILPDPINIGYQGVRNEIVTEINGKAVRNLQQLADIIDADGGLSEVTIESWRGAKLYLDKKGCAAANARIKVAYRIPALRRLDGLK